MSSKNKQRTIVASIAQKRSTSEKDPKTIKDLGIVNAWGGKTPELVTECRSKKHILTSVSLGRCYAKYSCTTCNYEYSVDSSD